MLGDSKVSLKAILVGALIDVGGSLVWGFVGGVMFGVAMVSSGHMPDPGAASVGSLPTVVLVASMVVGLGFTMLGGYVAGRLSPQGSEVLNAALVGVVSTLVGLLLGSSAMPLWYRILAVVGVLLCAPIGGMLARRRPATEL